MTYQNFCDAGLTGKFIALNIYLRRSKIENPHDLSFHLKKLEKEQQIKTKGNRRKAIIKIRVEIFEIENKHGIKKVYQF